MAGECSDGSSTAASALTLKKRAWARSNTTAINGSTRVCVRLSSVVVMSSGLRGLPRFGLRLAAWDDGRRLRPFLASFFREPHLRSEVEPVEIAPDHAAPVEVDLVPVGGGEEAVAGEGVVLSHHRHRLPLVRLDG